MQPSQHIAHGVAILLIGAAPLLSSCVSKPAATVPLKTIAGERIVLREGEYEEVYVTGSNIPVRVSKSPTATRLPGASAVTTLTPEEFQEMVRRGDALGSSYRH
jgi:hypothetical protein